jgi:hypothetical protein
MKCAVVVLVDHDIARLGLKFLHDVSIPHVPDPDSTVPTVGALGGFTNAIG